MRRSLGLRLVILAALSQLLCAWDTRTFARDLWLLLPDEAAEDDTDVRLSRGLSACTDGTVPPTGLWQHFSGDHPWGAFPVTTVAHLEKLAGRPVWTKHPISSSADLSREDGSFAHVNPSFVRWARTRLLPGVTDTAFRKATESRYQACLAPALRQLWAVRADLKSAPTCKGKMLALYREEIATVGSDGLRFPTDEWEACLGLEYGVLDESLQARMGQLPFLHGYFDALAWWLRREMDGSAVELELALKAVLQAYDPVWLAQHATPGFDEDPEALEASFRAAQAARGSAGGLGATEAAAERARSHASAALRADWDRRAEAAFAVCGAYHAELGERKSKIYAAMEANDEEAVQAAVREVDAWASNQQYGVTPLSTALEGLRVLVEEVQEASARGIVSDADAIGFIAEVQGRCGG